MIKPEAQQILKSIPAYTIHRQRRKRFPRNPVVVLNVRHQFQCDLCDVSNIASYKKRHNFIFCMIDCFFKKGSYTLIKSKGASKVVKALEVGFKDLGVPDKLQSDRGTVKLWCCALLYNSLLSCVPLLAC